MFDRCRCVSLAGFRADCCYLAASLLFHCGFLAHLLRLPSCLAEPIPSKFLPGVCSLHAENVRRTNKFCSGSNAVIPANSFRASCSGTATHPTRIPQGTCKEPQRARNTPKRVFLKNRGAQLQQDLHQSSTCSTTRAAVKHAHSNKPACACIAILRGRWRPDVEN